MSNQLGVELLSDNVRYPKNSVSILSFRRLSNDFPILFMEFVQKANCRMVTFHAYLEPRDHIHWHAFRMTHSQIAQCSNDLSEVHDADQQ